MDMLTLEADATAALAGWAVRWRYGPGVEKNRAAKSAHHAGTIAYQFCFLQPHRVRAGLILASSRPSFST